MDILVEIGQLMSRDMVLADIDNDVVLVQHPDLMPYYFSLPDATLRGWLTMRSIDTERVNSRLLRKALHIHTTNKAEIALAVSGVVITDTYWVRTEENQSWDTVRFNSNDFTNISLLGSFNDISKPYSRTPELTSIGSFEKCWRLEDGKWWLYKLAPYEHLYSEMAAYHLCKHFGYPVAEYEEVTSFDKFDYMPGQGFGLIRTVDFTNNAAVNFDPAESLGLKNEDISYNYNKLNEMSPTLAKQYFEIITMDVLIYNLDRHNQNFGVLRDVDTGEVVSLAPNFDNNLSLLPGIRGIKERTENTDKLFQQWKHLVQGNLMEIELPSLDSHKLERLLSGIQYPIDEESARLVMKFVSAGYSMLENVCKTMKTFYKQ